MVTPTVAPPSLVPVTPVPTIVRAITSTPAPSPSPEGLVLSALNALPATPPPTLVPSPTLIPPPTLTPPSTLTPLPSAETGRLPAGPRPLTLWAIAQGSELELLQQLAREWSDQNGRTLEVSGLGADAMRTNLLAVAIRNAPPTLLWGSDQDLAAFYADGQLQPVGEPPAPLLAAPEQTAQINGQRWGMPIVAGGGLVLYFNRRLVAVPPATTDELVAMARSTTHDNQYGIVYNWSSARWLLPWLNGYGGGLIGEGNQPLLDSPQMERTLSLLQELRASGPPPPTSYDQLVELFLAGQAAFMIDGEWAAEQFRSTPDTLDLGIAPLPLVNATMRSAAPALGGSYLMLHQSLAGPDLDAARSFIAYALRPETQRRFASIGRLPVLAATLDDPAIRADPLLASLASMTPLSPPVPLFGPRRCAWLAIDQSLSSLLVGQQQRPEVMATMQQYAHNCISGS